jgi:hypothetical protein
VKVTATRLTPKEAAGEHYVLYRLYRQDKLAALLPPRTAVVDVVIFDKAGGIGAMLQVKTSQSRRHRWVMGPKNERQRDARLFYALVDFDPETAPPVVYIVPSAVVADTLQADHRAFVAGGGHENDVRVLRPNYPAPGWLDQYREAWHLLAV